MVDARAHAWGYNPAPADPTSGPPLWDSPPRHAAAPRQVNHQRADPPMPPVQTGDPRATVVDSRTAVVLPEVPSKAEAIQAWQSETRGGALGWTLSSLWLGLTLAALAAVLTGWVSVLDLPSWVPTAGAVTLTTTYAVGLAVRTGGRALVSGLLALALSLAAVVSQLPVLLAGATVAMAVLSAVLAVMATKPAARFPGVVRECLVALLVAATGAFAVEAYGAEVSTTRVGYLALGLSLLGALGLVYRLGAGFQGLGRRGLIMSVGGVVLLLVALAYTEAVATWGSTELIDGIDRGLATIRSKIGAVPRPIEALLGVPALAWGVSTRARRRQGWWVSAFGAAGLSQVAVSLLEPEVTLAGAGLSLFYSAVLGLLIGYVVIRADKFFTGTRGRRGRQLEEASAHRPEPGRMRPLL